MTVANYVVTGGCGFIGSHLTRRLLDQGHHVLVIDDLSRPGSRDTHQELEVTYNVPRYRLRLVDLGASNPVSEPVVEAALAKMLPIQAVYHLAGQVAVTTSVKEPMRDMMVNIVGTVRMLQAVRKVCTDYAVAPRDFPLFVFNSTNKVYGHLDQVPLEKHPETGEYQPTNPKYMFGVREDEALDFYSPYGCSKGAADQYVRDAHRIYGMPTTVLRCSCIYGTEQYGIEDQGWVAWLTIAAMLRKRVSIYGDGFQVRDVLWINDLVDLYLQLADKKDIAAGKVYNIGGGYANRMNLNELIELLRDRVGPFVVNYAKERPGDQQWYVSYAEKVKQEIGWYPTTGATIGVNNIIGWVQENEAKIRQILPATVLNA